MSDPSKKVYLGDAVYAEFDGYHIVLTTSDGLHELNRICLEPIVMQSLVEYARQVTLRAAHATGRHEGEAP